MLEQLLGEISTIVNAYKLVRKANGEDFNIYKILGMSSNEEKTHSRFLAELLDVNGSHGQEDIFVQLFINQLDTPLDFAFDTKSSKAKVELYISPIIGETGGKIDIILIDKNKNKIIIENKINAPDQKNQLLRYYNYGKEEKGEFRLFYLNLGGTNTNEFSAGNLKEGEDYFTLSYKSDIKSWLEKCKKEAANHPILRESIAQYIHLINYLTNQSSDKKMSESITKIVLRNEESLKTVFELFKHQEEVYKAILELFEEELEKLAKKHQLGFRSIVDRNLNKGFFFWNDEMLKENLAIGFWFERKNNIDFCYGISYHKVERNHNIALKKVFESEFSVNCDYNSTDWLLARQYFDEEYRNWNNDIFLKVYKGEMISEIEVILEKILSIIKSID